MYRAVIFGLLTIATVGLAQQKPVTSTKTDPGHSATTPHPRESSLPSEETVNGFLHETFGYSPGMTWKIASIKPSEAEGLAEVTVVLSGPQGMQNEQFYVTQDGRHAITGEIIPFGIRPFAAIRTKLEKEQNGISRGPANAPVTIFEFSDLQCPHCKEAQPIIEKLMSEAKNIRLVFQNFPLGSHDWAEKGADYADCVGRTSNTAFWKFIQSIYDSQSDITAANADDKLKALADAAGVKGDEIADCAAKPATLGRVERSAELGTSVGVTGTPTLFINGRSISTIGTIPYELLKQLVEFAAQDSQKVGTAPK